MYLNNQCDNTCYHYNKGKKVTVFTYISTTPSDKTLNWWEHVPWLPG